SLERTHPRLEIFSHPEGRLIVHGGDGEGAQFQTDLDGTVILVVRGEPGTTAGPVVLSARIVEESNVITWEKAVRVEPVPAHQNIVGGIGFDGHIVAVEQQDGPNDTVLIAISAGQPLAFDDDSGVGAMAKLRLVDDCDPGSCEIVVGKRTNSYQHTHS